MNRYTINTANDFVWDLQDFLNFLIQHQHQSIYITNVGEGGCMQSTGVYDLIGLFEFEKVVIETGNSIESHCDYKIVLSPERFRFLDVTDQYKKYHDWNLKKVFG